MQKAGTLLSNRYRIRKVLGQGGMGAVYLVEAEALGGKLLAVKEMTPWGLPPGELQQAVTQFQREASFLAYLEHPNLVKVTDFFVEDGKHYLVMAYIRGSTLQEKLLSRGRPFSWTELEPWVHSLLDVLEYLHNQKPAILFRDLKPSNIMISEEGQLHLIDFGIARSADEGMKTTTFLQGTGTRGFSPIEQYGDRLSTDQRSDIYALGATLYYLLTGCLPPDAIERVSRNKTLQPLRQKEADIPAYLEAIVERALAVDAQGRYQTVAEMRDALTGPRSLLPKLHRPSGSVATESLPLQRTASLALAGLALVGGLLLKPASATLDPPSLELLNPTALASQIALNLTSGEETSGKEALPPVPPSRSSQITKPLKKRPEIVATQKRETPRNDRPILSLSEHSYPKAAPTPRLGQGNTVQPSSESLEPKAPLKQPSAAASSKGVTKPSQVVTGPSRPTQPVAYVPIYVRPPEEQEGIPGLGADPIESSSSVYTTSTQWASRGETTDPTQSVASGGPSLTNVVGTNPTLGNPANPTLKPDTSPPGSLPRKPGPSAQAPPPPPQAGKPSPGLPLQGLSQKPSPNPPGPEKTAKPAKSAPPVKTSSRPKKPEEHKSHFIPF